MTKSRRRKETKREGVGLKAWGRVHGGKVLAKGEEENLL